MTDKREAMTPESGVDLEKLEASQLEKLEKIRKRIAQLEAREQAILSRKSRQQRADETRRAIVIGKRIEALARHDKRARAVVELALANLEDQYRYLFRERWPDAVRGGSNAGQK